MYIVPKEFNVLLSTYDLICISETLSVDPMTVSLLCIVTGHPFLLEKY